MLTLIIVLFVLGYLAIAFEHQIDVNKAAVALVTGVVLWVLYVVGMPEVVATTSKEAFSDFLTNHPSLATEPFRKQCVDFITSHQLIEVLGEISSTLFFLLCAMTIVEIIDVHGGFAIITNRITTKSKTRLLWVISIVTFFMSAILDNMTTAIVMVMLVRRMIPNYKERWLFASMVIIAANSGGAWSPIGDITTIMLWVNGNITAANIIKMVFLPSLVSCLLPTFICARLLHGMLKSTPESSEADPNSIIKLMPRKERISITILGICCLISVPVFKTFTHLPPFMGILLALGVMWVYTEIAYHSIIGVNESLKHRVPRVLRHVDTPTILFFLGILLAVDALKATGVLGSVALFLDQSVHNVYITNVVIGLLSSVVDNVPLVAASMGMYPIADSAILATTAPEAVAYVSNFVQDGVFWEFLAYCAGVGGSVLIIGSVSGVVIMGIEKIPFGWYLKNISLMALAGYLAGAGVYILMEVF